jgi:anthranilate phosphoribosyltransferase
LNRNAFCRFNEPIKALIEKLRSGLDLQGSEVGYAVVLLLSDEIEDEKKVEFLTALHQKDESADEIVGFVRALGRALDPMIDPSDLPGPLIDVCGDRWRWIEFLQCLDDDHVRSGGGRGGRGQAW